MGNDRLPTVIGFVGALLVLAALVWFVGAAEVVAALTRARPSVLVLVLASAAVWLTAWGLALRTVLETMGAPVSASGAVLVYAGAVFSNNVTPFGQAGGEPLSALLIAEAADSEYETGLAAIASVDALHFVPSIGFAIVGFTFVAVSAVPIGRDLRLVAVVVALLAVALPVAAFLGWRYRYELEAAVVRVLSPVILTAGRLLPNRSAPSPESVEEGIEGFFVAVDRIATDRRTLLRALSLSAVGWFAQCVTLWLALYSLGPSVPFAAVLLAVPVGKIAGLTPLPGGSGAVEWVTTTVLVPTTGVSAAVAVPGVLVYRVATYWLPLLVGGGVASALGADRAALSER